MKSATESLPTLQHVLDTLVEQGAVAAGTVRAIEEKLRQSSALTRSEPWFVKLLIHPEPMQHVGQFWDRLTVGFVPGWVLLVLGALFYTSLGIVAYLARHIHGAEPEDEIAGIERNLEHWKL